MPESFTLPLEQGPEDAIAILQQYLDNVDVLK